MLRHFALLLPPRTIFRHFGKSVTSCILFTCPAFAQMGHLPDAPSASWMAASGKPIEGFSTAFRAGLSIGVQDVQGEPKRCPGMSWHWREPAPVGEASQACRQDAPLQSIVSTGHVKPLTPQQKAMLGVRDIVDPFNLLTVVGYSGIYVAAESHSPYGPGFKGFGRLTGYSLLEDTQGEFFGTFLIPTLAQEDPRYHRMPDRPVPRRILHALTHTVISQHDDGSLMPNYAVLVTYPVSAALSNAYVPGIGTSASDTFKRVGLGYATNPVGDLVAEFLPDVARRVHIRVVFVQQIVNKIATGAPNTQ